ncbi:hypothetical protein N9444_06080 [Gammaproteobacteria bacterium]|nr:hypothetical protein [Gammaproteobacteria bacterium]
MQLLIRLRSFALKLLKPSSISGTSIRLTVDTDGQTFICRIPELSLSATEQTIATAYTNLQEQLQSANFAFSGTTDQEILSEIAAIQRTEVFNRSIRKKSVLFLGISTLFFCLSIVVVPATVAIINTSNKISSLQLQDLVLGQISKVAERIEDIDPQNKANIQAELSTIRNFLADMLFEESTNQNCNQ